MAVSRLGRGESPADPAGPNEADPIVTLEPRSEWPSGWTQDDIASAIREKLRTLPGVQIVMAQPISDRVDEMVTGVRSDVAVKLFGDDLDVLKEKANEIIRAAGSVRGATDIRVQRIGGQQYLTVTVDRNAIARQGLNVADVHDVIETAIGGRGATEIYEGERRFQAVIRLPERLRDSIGEIRQITLTAPSGAQVALDSLARIELLEGPAQISRDGGKRRIVVGINVKDRDLGGFVAELQRVVEERVKLPSGYYFEWGGQFQNLERALGHLSIIVPVTIGAIFFLLFLLFNSLRFATLIITVLPFASLGGVIALAVTGEYLSVPASVGFIALWGIAVLNGVVLVSYIRKLRNDGLPLAQAVREGATQRFRPVMMTATVAMLALIPMLLSSGPGSEVTRPLAVVVVVYMTGEALEQSLACVLADALVDELVIVDNGSDAVDELARMMRVRRIALERFSENVVRPGMPLALMEETLVPIYLSHRYQVEAAAGGAASVQLLGSPAFLADKSAEQVLDGQFAR